MQASSRDGLEINASRAAAGLDLDLGEQMNPDTLTALSADASHALFVQCRALPGNLGGLGTFSCSLESFLRGEGLGKSGEGGSSTLAHISGKKMLVVRVTRTRVMGC